MADAKKTLGGLGVFAKRMMAPPDEGALSAIRSAGRTAQEEGAAARAAMNAQVAEQMAKLPARSRKAGEEAGLFHPVGGGIKLSKPTSGMHSTTVADPMFNPPDIGIITPERLVKEKAAIIPLIGDRAAGGRYLTHIGENELETPVRLTAGPRYMDANYNAISPEDSAAWESGLSVVTKVGNQAQRAGQGGRPVYGIYTAGSGTNTDFNVMGANALIQQIPFSNFTKKAEREFDRAMRVGTEQFPPVPNWPGIRSPDAQALLLDKSNGIMRTKLFGTMGKENFQSMGFPDVPATRKAIIEPELLDIPGNQAGFRLAKMDTNKRIIENPNIPSDYPKAMAGKVAGKLDVPADYKDIFQTHFDARRLLSQPEKGDYYSFSRSTPIQYADDEWLNRLMEQRLATDRMIKEGGYKDGGAIDIEAADRRLSAAIEKRMATGGAVDLDAADARLRAAIDARMGNEDVPHMADAGKVVKGATSVFKKLFADAPGEVAHKLAQERAALPPAKGGLGLPKKNTSEQRAAAMGFDTDVYHGTTMDFDRFVGRHPTYATEEPRIADIYANATSRHMSLNRPINAGPNIIPLKLGGKEFSVSDLGEGGGGWYADNLAEALGIPRARGAVNELPNYGIDRLKVTDMGDLGGIQTQHMIPAGSDNIRSRFAAFDPFRRNAAIAAAMGVAAPDLLAAEPKKKADGGKIVRGITQIGKRLLAERDVLPAAERDANLAKFLEKSEVKNRVYHGTNADFGKFDPAKLGGATNARTTNLGFFSTDNQLVANRFADSQSGANVMPLHVNIQNPLELGHRTAKERSSGKDPFIAMQEAITKIAGKKSWNEVTPEDVAVWKERLVDRGYDGIILRKTIMDGAGGATARTIEDPYHDFYIAFEPEQMKSAIGNRGTYDINEADLSKAGGGVIHMTDGGGAFKTLQWVEPQRFGVGGGASEDSGYTSKPYEQDETVFEMLKRNAPSTYDWATQNIKDELSQLKNPRAVKDFALRIGAQYLGGLPDFANLGLKGVDYLTDQTFASDKPYFGSEQYIDLMRKAGMLGENEFPITEVVAGALMPAGLVKKVVKKVVQANKKAKTAPEASNKRRGGLAAMAR
jgi:hypothetical protein